MLIIFAHWPTNIFPTTDYICTILTNLRKFYSIHFSFTKNLQSFKFRNKELSLIQHSDISAQYIFVLTSISIVNMKKKIPSNNMYKSTCPIPGEEKSKILSVNFILFSSHMIILKNNFVNSETYISET